MTTTLGGDSHVAALAAKVETDNNYLGQKGKGFRASEQKEFNAAVAACPGDKARCERAKKLGGLSEQRDQELAAACVSPGSSLCQAAVKVAVESGNVVFFDKHGKPTAVPADSPMIQATQDPRDGTWHYKIAAGVAEGLALDTGGGALEGVGSALRGLLRPQVGELAAGAAKVVRNGEVLAEDGKVLARQNPLTGQYEPVGPLRLSGSAKNATPAIAGPNSGLSAAKGVVATRVNVRTGSAEAKGSGLEYAWKKHGGAWGENKSAFSISKDELKRILQTPEVVKTPAYQSPISGNFIRTVDMKRPIGTDAKAGGKGTNFMTVITDKEGNLVNAFPGKTL